MTRWSTLSISKESRKHQLSNDCFAYSISPIAETRERALSFFQGSRLSKFSRFPVAFLSKWCSAYSILIVVETRCRALSCGTDTDFMRRLPFAFLTNGVFVVTLGGIELTTPVLWVRMLNHNATAPLNYNYVRLNNLKAVVREALREISLSMSTKCISMHL